MRAQRFPLELPVEYRPVGEGPWRQASTANVSASGVLVRATDPPTIDTLVEFRLALSAQAPDGSGEIVGQGRVVRLADPRESGQAGFAVAIEQYNLRQRSDRASH
jgi:hypothetical protein